MAATKQMNGCTCGAGNSVVGAAETALLDAFAGTSAATGQALRQLASALRAYAADLRSTSASSASPSVLAAAVAWRPCCKVLAGWYARLPQGARYDNSSVCKGAE